MPASRSFDPLPKRAEDVLDPDWLLQALDVASGGDRVVSVQAVETTGTIADKIRFSVTVEHQAATRTYDLCAKGHFSNDMTSLDTEAHAYRDLHSAVSVRAPRAHYVAVDDAAGRGLIIMDDVVAMGGQILDAHQPYSLETCRGSLSQLALLHARTWSDPRWDVDWLDSRIEKTAAYFPPDVLQGLLDDGRGPDLPPILRDAATLHAAIQRTAALPATCVIHGDTHSGNAFIDAKGQVSWLDWQITQRGHWSVDVSYHLGSVLDVETRRSHERDLLSHYLSELSGHGVSAPGFEEAWASYAAGFAWGYLLWSSTMISSREVVLIHVPRLGAAISDHDTFARLGVA